jgi:hypothetical protein
MEPPNPKESDSNFSTLNEVDGVTPQTPDLEKQATGQATERPVPAAEFPETDLDQGIVGWDGQDDPNNPQNFTNGKKWALLTLISAMTLISPLASSMFSPAIPYMAADFGETNETILSFSVSIYLLGYTVSRNHINQQIPIYALKGDDPVPYLNNPSNEGRHPLPSSPK